MSFTGPELAQRRQCYRCTGSVQAFSQDFSQGFTPALPRDRTADGAGDVCGEAKLR